MEIIISNTLFTGKVLEHLPKVDSTNNYAKEMLAKSSPINGTVILADEQFAGRGQTGNIWQSEAHKKPHFQHNLSNFVFKSYRTILAEYGNFSWNAIFPKAIATSCFNKMAKRYLYKHKKNRRNFDRKHHCWHAS